MDKLLREFVQHCIQDELNEGFWDKVKAAFTGGSNVQDGNDILEVLFDVFCGPNKANYVPSKDLARAWQKEMKKGDPKAADNLDFQSDYVPRYKRLKEAWFKVAEALKVNAQRCTKDQLTNAVEKYGNREKLFGQLKKSLKDDADRVFMYKQAFKELQRIQANKGPSDEYKAQRQAWDKEQSDRDEYDKSQRKAWSQGQAKEKFDKEDQARGRKEDEEQQNYKASKKNREEMLKNTKNAPRKSMV